MRQCAKTLKAQSTDESSASLTARPNIDYRTVLAVFDAIRGDGGEALFPDIVFGLPRSGGTPSTR